MSRLVGTLSTAVVDRFSFGPYDRRDTSNIVPLALLDHWGGVEYQCLECRRPIYLDISRLEYPNWRHHNRRWRGDVASRRMTRHITRITAIALVTLALLPAAAPRSDSKPGMPEVPGTPAASLGPSPSGIDASVTPASGNAAWSRSGAPETLEWKPSEENPGGSDAAGDDPIASSSAGGSGPPSGAPPTTAPTSTTAGSRAPRSPARVVTGARPAAGPKAVAIHATWYCKPPRYPRCTIGYPAGSFVAAISPDLRAWTGRMVRVRFGSAHVDVRIVDCDCQAEHAIDLYAVAFAKLAPTSVGELTVTLELLNG